MHDLVSFATLAAASSDLVDYARSRSGQSSAMPIVSASSADGLSLIDVLISEDRLSNLVKGTLLLHLSAQAYLILVQSSGRSGKMARERGTCV